MAFFAEGREVQCFATYGGARRGTPVSSFIRVDDRPIRVRCDIEQADALLCFDASLLEGRLLAAARPGALIVVNSQPHAAAVRRRRCRATACCRSTASPIAQRNGLGRIVNSALLGAFARALEAPALETLSRTIADAAPKQQAGERAGLPRGLPRIGRGAIAAGRRMNTPRCRRHLDHRHAPRSLKTGTWRAALPDTRQPPSPCHLACPVDGRIAQWISRRWRATGAAPGTRSPRTIPFPRSPGASATTRARAPAIAPATTRRSPSARSSAMSATARSPRAGAIEPVAASRARNGSPSSAADRPGLSAAYQLRRRGYAVTIFEAQPELGGLLRDGIPPYRLPRDVLDGEIARLLDARHRGALRRRARDAPQDFERLRAEFDAVYLAIGAAPPEAAARSSTTRAPWVMDGADLPRAARTPARRRRWAGASP